MFPKLNKKKSKTRNPTPSGGRVRPAYYSGQPKTSQPSSPFKKAVPLKPKKAKKTHKPLNYVYLGLFILVIIYCSLLKNNPKIELDSTTYHSQSDYAKVISTKLGSLRNHSKLTFDRGGLSTSLKKEFPELSSVDVKIGLISQSPLVKLTVAAPSFNYANGSNIYVISSGGVVVATSKQLPQAAKLPLLTDQSGFSAEPGKQVLGTSAIAFINTLIAQCQRAKVSLGSLTLPARPQELDLRASGSNYYVKFDLNGDPTLQAGQYLAAKHKFDSEGAGPEQYLDVRIIGKVYYK